MEIKQSTRIQTSLLNGVDGASCGDATYSPFHRGPRRKPNEVFAMGRGESATITFVTQLLNHGSPLSTKPPL